ncbi:hypothetical protein ABZW18_25605 [Streptomyces sp. NPDC004647]|uniref:hypothetical protein n=1 Tax=Streptomyces sp. NPDC004647 TaxID=3154671 RepID=UPI0033AE2DB9
MAVDSARDGVPDGTHGTGGTQGAHGAHASGCACGDCPYGAREGHRRAVAAFIAQREELAAGQGVPGALVHSAGASRQWVSDELTQSARTAGESARAEGRMWLRRRRGGLIGPLIGEDNRLSTSRAVAAGWVLVAAAGVLVPAVALAVTGDRARVFDGLRLGSGAGLLTVLALTCVPAVAARAVVAVRVRAQRLQKVSAARPHAADLVTDDAGRGSFADVQYLLVTAVVALFAVVRLVREPQRLPDLPWGLVGLVAVSGATYMAAKWAEGGRPVVLAVVRAREAGDLDGPIRPGDDIEIRGRGFVPPGAGTPEALARMVVRIGTVHVHVPLVPVAGGFGNPTDAVLTVPVPAEVEPGRVDVQVVTAAGAVTNRCPIDVVDG